MEIRGHKTKAQLEDVILIRNLILHVIQAALVLLTA